MYMHYNHCHRATAHLQLKYIILLLLLLYQNALQNYNNVVGNKSFNLTIP